MPQAARRWLSWQAAALAVITGALAGQIQPQEPVSREELARTPLVLKALHRSAITLSPDRNGLVAFVAKGQPVTVLEMGPTMDYISVQAPTGPAQGWLDATSLEAPPAAWLDRFHQQHDHAAVDEAIIDNHEIVSGMTRAEVRSSLGRPDRTWTVRLPGSGERQEQWVYITYRYLPVYHDSEDQNGEARRVVSYQRLPVGETVVVFENGRVLTFSREGGAILPGAGDQAAPPKTAN